MSKDTTANADKVKAQNPTAVSVLMFPAGHSNTETLAAQNGLTVNEFLAACRDLRIAL